MPHGPPRYQAILFELEGVLADTAPLRRTAFARALSAEGLQLSSDELATIAGGRSARAAAGRLRRQQPQLDDTAVDLVALRAEREFESSLAHGLSLSAGARALVEALAGRSRLGVVTRLQRRQATTILELAELEPMFELVVAAEDAEPKPSPAPFAEAIARLARRAPVRRERVLALEDSLDGISSAASAGIRCVAVGKLPAHEALEACGFIASLAGITPEELERVAAGRDAGEGASR